MTISSGPGQLPRRELPLTGRVALVTGLSRRVGIGYAIVQRLLDDGASVFASGWTPHDDEMPWGRDPFDPNEFLTTRRFAYTEADLAEPEAPTMLTAAAIDRFGALDIVIADHARSSHQPFATTTAEELDACWAINVRATVLLAQALHANRDRSRAGGRFIMFTSGQHLQAMDSEIAYAISKGAIHQMTASIANAVADDGITVNTINPGPVDTGYAEGDWHQAVADAFPGKRWGQPVDVARLVAWLVSDEGGWITGQVIDSEGGFRRWELTKKRE